MRKQKGQQEVKRTGQTLIHEDIRESGHEEDKKMKAQIFVFKAYMACARCRTTQQSACPEAHPLTNPTNKRFVGESIRRNKHMKTEMF